MGDFDNAYNPIKIYSNLKLSNSNDNEVTKMQENPKKPVKERKILGNLKGKKMRPENLKELAYAGETFDKERELENPEKPAYVKGTFNRLGKEVESITLPTPKTSAFITLVESNDFDSLYIPCIVSKQTRAII